MILARRAGSRIKGRRRRGGKKRRDESRPRLRYPVWLKGHRVEAILILADAFKAGPRINVKAGAYIGACGTVDFSWKLAAASPPPSPPPPPLMSFFPFSRENSISGIRRAIWFNRTTRRCGRSILHDSFLIWSPALSRVQTNDSSLDDDAWKF